MKGFVKRHRPEQPLLAPLAAAGRFPRLPAAAAPIAVTLVGGVALVAVLGSLLGREAAEPQPQPTPVVTEDRTETPAPDITVEAAQPLPIEEAAAETAADLPAFEPEPEPDPAARTASILPARPAMGSFLPSVPVAETEEEIAALEEVQRREVEANVGEPSTEETASFRQETGTMRPAVATRYVNMRAGPDDDAEVLMVVPAQAGIEAEDDCNWCAVVYQGRSGYIYKSFISYAD